MKDTRDTAYNKTVTKENSSCKFEVGDEVLSALDFETTVEGIQFDKSFGGWLVIAAGSLGGVHEQNFILKTESKIWRAYQDGLWSYWKRKRYLENLMKWRGN